jgi:hypothetical protein
MRRGFALQTVVIAIALVGALAAGAFLAAFHEARAGREMLSAQPALLAAEGAIVMKQRSWDRARTISMLDGETTRPDTLSFSDGSSAVVRITRLDPLSFWAIAEGVSAALTREGAARRTVNLFLRVAIPDVRVEGALTTRGAASIRDTSLVSGIDSTPGALTGRCPPASAGLAAVVAADTSRVSATPLHLIGTPPKSQQSFASDSTTYSAWGDEAWRTLVAHADIVLAGGSAAPRPAVSGSRCDVHDSRNWGDPRRTTPCGDYYPIIVASSSLRVGPGIGQGVLLVDGDLELDGLEFHGLIVARDDLSTAHGPNSIIGAALTGDANPADPTQLSDGTVIQFSRCVLDRALRGSARLVRAKQRAWAEFR